MVNKVEYILHHAYIQYYTVQCIGYYAVFYIVYLC